MDNTPIYHVKERVSNMVNCSSSTFASHLLHVFWIQPIPLTMLHFDHPLQRPARRFLLSPVYKSDKDSQGTTDSPPLPPGTDAKWLYPCDLRHCSRPSSGDGFVWATSAEARIQLKGALERALVMHTNALEYHDVFELRLLVSDTFLHPWISGSRGKFGPSVEISCCLPLSKSLCRGLDSITITDVVMVLSSCQTSEMARE